jgi:2-polyprenyl-3-methyl-5-hydroxy-6-metoxy-1,4-benzoquinol methylase
MQQDKVTTLTDVAYWDRTWSDRAIPVPLDPRAPGLNGVVQRRWHRYFADAFRRIGIAPGDRILEAGCGGSVFLPYFAREFGLVAEGIDNSPEGCALSEAIAARATLRTAIHCDDVLSPPERLKGRYRVVYSMGLAEHFRPTTQILDALAAFLQPGGWLISVVPNMHGLVGGLQKAVDPEVYGVHVPLSPEALAQAHRDCGLAVESAEHVMTANFSVVNFSGASSRVRPNVGLRAASWASKAVWVLEKAGLPEIPNGVTSPYVAVLARKGA